MRSVFSGLLTVIAMVCVIVAIPTMWVNERVVSADGFAASAEDAARNSEVQQFFANKVGSSVADSTSVPLAGDIVEPLARNYARSDAFVADFRDIARQQHAWLFTEPGPDTDLHVMDVNITPMANRVIASANLPQQVRLDRPVYIGIDQHRLSAGSLESTGNIVRSVAWIATIGAVITALLALLIANRRSVVLIWLGVGIVLAGIASYAVALLIRTVAGDKTAGSDEAARRTVEVVADGVSADLVQWAAVSGAVGAVVVVAGLLVRMVSRRPDPAY
ncbi:hypothetical protein [Gordonia zhaorongruii]|uniref:hypothetical protein n=1 Tax=Gordonia zhaorongruii TaxID=2597659 RepID=UPI0010462D3C|nr:hypothetical protein [Gordonia zhaorongruii]